MAYGYSSALMKYFVLKYGDDVSSSFLDMTKKVFMALYQGQGHCLMSKL